MKGSIGVAAVFGALAATACNPFVTGGDDRMTVEPLGGSLALLRDGARIVVQGSLPIRRGDVIETGSGEARVLMEDDRTVHLAPSTRVAIVDGATVEAMSGALVADVSADAVVMIDEVTVRIAAGAVRVERDRASAEAAALAGEVILDAPGQEPATLPRLYRSAIVTGQILTSRPYRVERDDRWDLRYLHEVVELDLQLERYAQALGAQLRRSPSLTDFRGLVGPGAVDLLRPHIGTGVPAVDLTIGLTVATTSGEGIDAALERVFALRAEGAQWGVVATLMEVPARPLLAALERFGSEVLAATESGASGLVFGPRPGIGGHGDEPPGGTQPPRGGERPPGDCDNVIDCTLEGTAGPRSPTAPDAGLP